MGGGEWECSGADAGVGCFWLTKSVFLKESLYEKEGSTDEFPSGTE